MLRKQHWQRLSLLLVSLILLSFGLAATVGKAQETDADAQRPRKVTPTTEPSPDEILRIDTDLVSVDVQVTDTQGRLVRNLRKEDFKVYVDDVEQPISFFHVEQRSGQPRPVAIVFALDMSGSMTAEEVDRLGDAMRAFSNHLEDHPAVYAVLTFGMRVKTIQRFTSDRVKLERAFDRLAREPSGLSTHTYDAVDDAIRMLVRHAPRTRERRLMKRAVVVITDGFPVGDTVAPKTVIERANAADVSIYVVTLPSFSRMTIASTQAPLPTPLDVSGLAELTGGKSVYANERDYEPLFRALAEEVTSAYVLAFYPPEEKRRDGVIHNLRVEGPAGLMVRQSRPSYQAEKGRKRE